MFLRRSLASLAHAYTCKLLVYDFVLCRYIWGLAPPPPYQKAGYATLALALANQEASDHMKMTDFVPHSLHEIAATVRTQSMPCPIMPY